MSRKLLSRPPNQSTVAPTEPGPRARVISFEGVRVCMGPSDVAELDTANWGRGESEALETALRTLTPEQRLTVWALVEHPRLLDGVATIVDELYEGLR